MTKGLVAYSKGGLLLSGILKKRFESDFKNALEKYMGEYITHDYNPFKNVKYITGNLKHKIKTSHENLIEIEIIDNHGSYWPCVKVLGWVKT